MDSKLFETFSPNLNWLKKKITLSDVLYLLLRTGGQWLYLIIISAAGLWPIFFSWQCFIFWRGSFMFLLKSCFREIVSTLTQRVSPRLVDRDKSKSSFKNFLTKIWIIFFCCCFISKTYLTHYYSISFFYLSIKMTIIKCKLSNYRSKMS